MTKVRPTLEKEADLLPGIERSACRAFLQVPGLEWIADDDVQSAASHRKLIRQGASWVAEDQGGDLVGFLSAEAVDGELHVWGVAVRHDKQGLGHGRALVRKAIQAARQKGLAAVTLTTFRDIKWNEPFYQRLDFRTLAPERLDERLTGILRSEVEHGMPRQRRCAMRLALGQDNSLVK